MTALMFIASTIVALMPTFTVGQVNGVSALGLAGMLLFGVLHRRAAS